MAPKKEKGEVLSEDLEKKAAAKKKTKSKEEDLPSREDMAAILMEEVNNKLKGRAELVKASDLSMPFITKRFPTGFLTLDLALRGGFPCGGVSQIVGPENSGKSYLYWQIIRQLQSIFKERMMVLLAMTEMRADRTQGRSTGVAVAYSDEDIESMNKARVDNGYPEFTEGEVASMKHEIGTIHEAHGLAGEDLYDVILKAVNHNVYHLIVIDSFGSIMSGAEAENKSLKDKTFGGAAGVNTQFLRKLGSLLLMKDKNGRTRETCIIGINQIRDDLKKAGGGGKPTGGHMLEHAKFVDLSLFPGATLGDHVDLMGPSGVKQRFVAWGKEINWQIEKGKAGIRDGERGVFEYVYAINGIDFYKDTIVAGLKLGIIKMSGAWLNIDIGGQTYQLQGRDKLVKFLQDDVAAKAHNSEDAIINQIRAKAFHMCDINIDYDWTY